MSVWNSRVHLHIYFHWFSLHLGFSHKLYGFYPLKIVFFSFNRKGICKFPTSILYLELKSVKWKPDLQPWQSTSNLGMRDNFLSGKNFSGRTFLSWWRFSRVSKVWRALRHHRWVRHLSSRTADLESILSLTTSFITWQTKDTSNTWPRWMDCYTLKLSTDSILFCWRIIEKIAQSWCQLY